MRASAVPVASVAE